MSLARLLAVLCFLLSTAEAQQIRARLVAKDWLIENLRTIPSENADRAERMKELFEKVGCKGDQLTTQAVKRSKLPNVICTLPGETDEIVVVGAHFDKVKAGKGVADNGTGAVLLPALYMALTEHKQRHTFVFVAFTDEEVGLVGSAAYARAIPKDDRKRYRAMVNIDTLGLGPTTVWHQHSHKNLRRWFEELATILKIENFQYVDVDNVGDGDSSSFVGIGVPVIDFHSITPATLSILHSERDNMEAIQTDEYFASYKLIAYYLAFLDFKLPELGKSSK